MKIEVKESLFNNDGKVWVGEKKTFYYLPTDSYNQADGTVDEVKMTQAEYEYYKQYNWLYDNEYDAMRRAQA